MAKAEYRSSLRSKQLIQEALMDLLTEKPLYKITVSDVVKRADINRGTFYAHYRDIPDAIDHLIEQTISIIQEAMLSQDLTLDSAGLALLNALQRILEQDLPLFKRIFTSEAATIMQERFLPALMDFMLENKERLYTGSDAEYQIIIRFCAGGISNLYQDWFSGKLTCSLSELTQICYSMVVQTVRNQAGLPSA